MHSENSCIHDIRKASEILEETRSVIPDCCARLSSAKDSLRVFLVPINGDSMLG